MEKDKRLKIDRLQVEGFKSIRKMDLEMRDINVLIGGNGSGKSNLLSLFELFRVSTTDWREFFKRKGGANTFLFYGSKVTKSINVKYVFNDLAYSFSLVDSLPDDLDYENITLRKVENNQEKILFNTNVNDNRIFDKRKYNDWWKLVAFSGMVFHFNDTSETSGIRRSSNIHNSTNLNPDGSNLASILYRFSQKDSDLYNLIIDTIRLAAPFFDDFILEPTGENNDYLLLNWREREQNSVFGPHQLPDGLLRFIALTTVLFYETKLWRLIIIDEPELGLHPFAIELFASMVREASHHAQIIIATQSETLLRQFEPEDIIVVEREDGESKFKRLNSDELSEWLEDYSIDELWEKNVLGGRP